MGLRQGRHIQVRHPKNSKEKKQASNLRSILRKKNCHVSARRFSIQFCVGTPEGHQKSIFNTSKVKKNKDTYGI
jgi:hypothetical protein